jgi:hypothetical protein
VLTVLGCGTQRVIEITSEPSGALVHLNDREVGRTPVEVPFEFYGVYDVRLSMDGREPVWTEATASAPWWEYPPIDLMGELFGGRSEVRWHFELPAERPTDDAAIDALTDRAGQMRSAVGR